MIIARPRTSLRSLAPADRADFVALRMESLRTDPLAFGTEADEESSYALHRFDILMRYPDDFCLGFFADGQLAGKLCFNRDRRRRTRHRGTIWGFYLRPAFRGQGMGRSLLEVALDRIDQQSDLEQIKLVVVSTNAAAIALYTEAGFTVRQLEEQAYRLGAGHYLDLLHMTRHAQK